MSKIKATEPKFQISSKVTYIQEESRPDQNYYFFSYKITIKNIGSTVAQLVQRHWIIEDALGRIEEVKGPGVIGQQPKIHPSQAFEYESACPLGTATGSMKGFYTFLIDSEEKLDIQIPEFFLIAPSGLH